MPRRARAIKSPGKARQSADEVGTKLARRKERKNIIPNLWHYYSTGKCKSQAFFYKFLKFGAVVNYSQSGVIIFVYIAQNTTLSANFKSTLPEFLLFNYSFIHFMIIKMHKLRGRCVTLLPPLGGGRD